MTKTEVASRELAKLLGLTSTEIADLARRKIIISGSKRATYKLQDSVRNYVEYLRRVPAEQKSENPVKESARERAKPEAGQADLPSATVKGVHGHMVFASDFAKSETNPLGVDDTRGYFQPRSRLGLLSKRVRSFQIYIREGRYYTVWDK
jgi:phage terminase Nu1 subunit (DNA packaging protein)